MKMIRVTYKEKNSKVKRKSNENQEQVGKFRNRKMCRVFKEVGNCSMVR